MLSKYPSDTDAQEARQAGFGYGSGNEGFIEGKTARVMGRTDRSGKFTPESGAGMLLSEALSAVDDRTKSQLLDLDDPKNAALQKQLGNVFSRAALAANRIPIAALGFDPRRVVMDTAIGRANIGGAYSKDKDAIYANLDAIDPSSVLHESIHRGLQKLRSESTEAAKIMLDLPGEESTVRWLMQSEAGDPEKGAGKTSDEQRETGRYAFNDMLSAPRYKKALARLQEISQELIKERRPRGPN